MHPNRSRRSALRGSSPVGPAHLSPYRPRRSVVVIGAGAFGGWSALQLQRKGARVLLVDAWGPGNSRASSGGETRIIRATYGPARIYTEMAARALRLWQENEERWSSKLLFRTGVLWMAGSDSSYEHASIPLLTQAGIRFEQLSTSECARRWPQINFDGVFWGIYETHSGYLLARRSCEIVLNAFVREGGEYRQAHIVPGLITANRLQGISIAPGEMLEADAYVFACGPWLGKILPFLASHITPTRQEVFFFGVAPGDSRFSDAQLPTWIDFGQRFYGIPGNDWRGLKVADDRRGVTVDPTGMERLVSKEALVAARSYVDLRFPGMRGAPLVESRVCQYENSIDQNFLLDRHPEAENIWIVGGGSGHGFKHGPVVGEMVSDAVLHLKASPAEFALARLLKAS
jgi:sarcosine oxidase